VLPALEELRTLPPPYEILELAPNEEKCFTVIDWELGKMVIHPRWPGAPKEKVVLGCRLHTPKEDKPLFPHYWDVTASTLVPQVYTILKAARVPPNKVRLCIKKIGVAPKARFQVRLVPLE